MKCMTPRSDQQKIALLRQILSELTAPNSQVPHIPEPLIENLATAYEAYQQQHQELIETREAWRHQGAKRIKQRRELEMTLRDIYQQVKRKGRRQKIPAEIFEAFGLKEDGSQKPETRAMKAPIEQAKSVLTAAQIASTKGYTLLNDPNPTDLETALHSYQQTRARQTETRNQERQSLANIRKIRAEVHDQLIRLKLAVRLGSVGQSAAQQRAHFEALGFSYKPSNPNEPKPEPEPQTEPTNPTDNHAKHAHPTSTAANPTHPTQNTNAKHTHHEPQPSNAKHAHHTLNAAGHLVRSLKGSHGLAQDSHPGCREPQPSNAKHKRKTHPPRTPPIQRKTHTQNTPITNPNHPTQNTNAKHTHHQHQPSNAKHDHQPSQNKYFTYLFQQTKIMPQMTN